jgi:FkbM family methyltransferase
MAYRVFTSVSGRISVLAPVRPYYLPLFKDVLKPDPEIWQFIPFIKRSDNVVEVGANIGKSTDVYCKVCSFIHAFEPNPYALTSLKIYLRKYQNVKIYPFGLFEENKESLLHIGRSRHKVGEESSVFHVLPFEYRTSVKVTLRRLDSLELKPTPSVLILDCEGSEDAVLRGSELSAIRMVALETHLLQERRDGTFENVKEILFKAGFHLSYFKEMESRAAPIIAVFER